MTAFHQVVVCCDVKGCRSCHSSEGRSIKAARNNLWLGGWTRKKKRDQCPLHNPHRNDYQERRTSPEWREHQSHLL